MPSFRLFRSLIGFALVALWLTAPAAAWNIHQLAHEGCPVALNAPHDHVGGKVVMVAEGAPSDHGRPQDADHGHDHMLSTLAGFSATLPDAMALPPAIVDRVDPPGFVVRVPAEIFAPPPARPPRAA